MISEFQMIELHRIRPPLIEGREQMTAEGLEDLRADIEKRGIINPITVKDLENGSFEIIAGHRRYLCAQKLHFVTVPCMIRRESDRDAEMIKIAENFKREDVDPYSEAKFYKALMSKYGLSAMDIALASNRTKTYIQSRLDLINGDQVLAEAVRDGQIGIGVALKLNELNDEKTRHYYLSWAIQHGATVRLVDQWVRDANSEIKIAGHEPTLVTDPNSINEPSKFAYICDICRKPVDPNYIRTIFGHEECKFEVLQAIAVAQKMEK